MQFLAARSRCINLLLARYSIPFATCRHDERSFELVYFICYEQSRIIVQNADFGHVPDQVFPHHLLSGLLCISSGRREDCLEP